MYNTITYNDEDKDNILARSYTQQFLPPLNLAKQDHLPQVNETVRKFLIVLHDDPLIVIQSLIIHNIISKIKKRKSSGYDKIYNTVLKNLSPNFIISITHLTNSISKFNYLPNLGKSLLFLPSLNLVLTFPILQTTYPFHNRRPRHQDPVTTSHWTT